MVGPTASNGIGKVGVSHQETAIQILFVGKYLLYGMS